MGYTLELGHAERRIIQPAGYVELEGFRVAEIQPFSGGSTIAVNPADYQRERELETIKNELNLPIDTPDDFQQHWSEGSLVPASIDITFNYSPRIREVTGTHLAALDGDVAIEGVPLFMQLIAELDDDPDYSNYWNPTDGNIKHLAKTLLDWTFQVPDGYFRSYG